MSIGGLLPVYETCVGCASAKVGDYGAYNTLVKTDTPNFHAVGYFVTFPTDQTLIKQCGDNAVAGKYKYGLSAFAAGCEWYSLTTPGVDGMAPYYYAGSAIVVNITRYNSNDNPTISFSLFPRAVRADGSGSAGCTFVGNTAGLPGGAVHIDSGASNVFIMDSSFERNSASVGGAVALNDSNSGVYFYSTTFSGNIASASGGAVAMLSFNLAVHFTDCFFRANGAQYGGALYLYYFSGFSARVTTATISLKNATFTRNVAALDGGGVYAGVFNVLSLTDSRLELNTAGSRGGGLFAADAGNNRVQLDSTTFTANRARTSGGAVGLSSGNALTVNAGTAFASNRVDGTGGAIAMTASSLLFGPGAVTFRNNSAGSTGSGLYVASSSTSSVAFANSTTPVLFTRNRCLTHGVTLYWVADGGSGSGSGSSSGSGSGSGSVLLSPSAPFARRLLFSTDNTAPVGTTLATQATQLVTGTPSSIVVKNRPSHSKG